MPVTNKPEKQPQVINIEQASTPETYRAGLHLELQKFPDSRRDKRRDKQLLLFDIGEPGVTQRLPATGLNLTVAEDRALSAIQKLLDKTGYEGHEQIEVNSEDFKYRGTLPVLKTTYTEYLEAYGLKRYKGSFKGAQVEQAIAALESLATVDRYIFYLRKRQDGKYDVIRNSCPLIRLEKLAGWKGLTEEESSQPPEEKASRGFSITVSPPFVDQLYTFFVLKPVSLHADIKQVTGGRLPRTTLQLLNWLLTCDILKVKIDESRLFEKLGLSADIEARHKTRAETKLQEALSIAYTLNYLTEPASQDGTGVYTLHLNSERCSRVTAKVKRVEEAKKKAEQAAAKKAKRIEAAKEKAEQKKNSRH